MPLRNTSCEIVLRHLWDFHNERTDDDLRREIEVHLASCSSCKGRSENEDYPIEHVG